MRRPPVRHKVHGYKKSNGTKVHSFARGSVVQTRFALPKINYQKITLSDYKLLKYIIENDETMSERDSDSLLLELGHSELNNEEPIFSEREYPLIREAINQSTVLDNEQKKILLIKLDGKKRALRRRMNIAIGEVKMSRTWKIFPMGHPNNYITVSAEKYDEARKIASKHPRFQGIPYTSFWGEKVV